VVAYTIAIAERTTLGSVCKTEHTDEKFASAQFAPDRSAGLAGC
jgi:hypothetical protein